MYDIYQQSALGVKKCKVNILGDDLALHHGDFNRGIEVHNSSYIWCNHYTKYATSSDVKQALEPAYLLGFSRNGGENVTFSGTILQSSQ